METNTLRIFDIKTLLNPVKRNWFIVLLAFVSVMTTVVYITFTAEYVYEAAATLSIRDTSELQSQLFNIPSFLAQKSLINNQVAHLQSRTLAAEVVKRLQQSDQADSLVFLGNKANPSKKTFKDKMMEKLGKKPQPTQEPGFQDLIARFQKNARVSADPESDILFLRARSSSGYEAAVIVNTWVKAYQAYSQADTRGEVTQTKEFIEKKLKEIEKKLDEAQKALSDYQKEEKIVALSEETQQLVEQSATFQSELDKTRTELEAVEQQLSFLHEELDKTHKQMAQNLQQLSTPAIKEIQELIAQKESEKAATEARFMSEGIAFDQSPRIRQLDSQIKGLKSRLNTEMTRLIDSDLSNLNPLDRSVKLVEQILSLETDRNSLVARKDKQQEILKEYSKRLAELPDKSLKLADLELDVQVHQNLYLTFKENHENIKTREAGQMDIVRIVDLAEPPKFPVLPKKGRNLFMGVFFGMLLGIGMAYSRDYFQDAIRAASDIERYDIRVLGTVVQYTGKRKLSLKREKPDEGVSRAKAIYPYLITHRHNHSAVAESYRSIRTALYFADADKPWRTLLVTSPNPSEGKSTTAANMAITIAQKGVKTLLIDADLRRPVMDILFTGGHRNLGFSNVLSGEANWKETIRETTVEGLSVMGAGMGVTNSSELISSSALPDFIMQVRKEYGAIVFDSAPILPVTDTVVLSSLMDGVVMVVKANQTPRDSFVKSMKLIENVRARFLGCVLTGLKQQDPYGYAEYYSTYTHFTLDKEEVEG